MTAAREYLVSSSGVLTVPQGERRRLLSHLVSRDEHAEFVRSLADDPDLETT